MVHSTNVGVMRMDVVGQNWSRTTGKDRSAKTCGGSTIKLTLGQIEVLSGLDKLNC